MAQSGIENVPNTNININWRIRFEWKKRTLNFLSFDNYFFNQLGQITQRVEISVVY